MPDEPVSAPETETQTTPATDAATAAPPATPTDASPSPDATKAVTPASPAAPMDVHAELMKVATAAVQKTAGSDPSAPQNQDNGKAADTSAVPAERKVAAPGKPDAAAKPNGAAKP